MKRLLNALHRADRVHAFFPPRSSVLIALSGGPDSVCLTLLLKMIRASRCLRLAAAHIHHGLRPSASADEAWVRRFCRTHDIPCFVERVAVGRRAKAESESIEEAARRARYAALIRIAGKERFGAIATAHTADDQAETVLMRLASGSGLSGLSGIASVRMAGRTRIIRPLLGVPKRDVLEALSRAKTTFRSDRSNVSGRFLRNRVRAELLPLLRERVNPRADEHLADLAADAACWRAWADAEAARFVQRYGARKARTMIFSETSLKRVPGPLRASVFMKVLADLTGREQHLRREHIRQIEELLVLRTSAHRRLAFGATVRRTIRGRVRRIVWEFVDSPRSLPYNARTLQERSL